MDVPHVRLPVLLSFELAVGTESAGEPLGGVDSVHVFVPTFLLDKLITQLTPLVLIITSASAAIAARIRNIEAGLEEVSWKLELWTRL